MVQLSYFRSAGPAPAGTVPRVGILLVNLGTPARLSLVSVIRYLGEFLRDRRVIDASPVFWWPLLFGLILPLRSPIALRNYRRIWMPEGSPLAVWSFRLADRLRARLGSDHADAVRLELAMTYGEPSLDQAIARLMDSNVNRLLVLPLFPQYCASTTGAVFDRVVRSLNRWRFLPEVRFVNHYWSSPAYVKAIADGIRQAWAQAGTRSHLLLSFHGIPQRYVTDGDPYRMHVEGTAARVRQELGLKEQDMTLAFQSRFGRARWLEPYTRDSLAGLARRGVREVTVAAPSFAVDCLETLEEIGVQYQGEFARTGGILRVVSALNDSDAHVEVLRTVITRHLVGWL